MVRADIYGNLAARARPCYPRMELCRGCHIARILVVDDEPLVAMLVQQWIAELGHETIGPAGSIRGALELLGASRPDAAILDLSVDEGPTYPVADALAVRSIPFAFASGHGRNAIDEKYRDGALLAKPFDFAQFSSAVDLLLTGSPSQPR